MEHPSNNRFYVPARYVLAFMTSLGLANAYAMRVSLSVAIVDMKEEFGWDSETRGIVLSSFYYGYIFTQVPGGLLATRFSPKWVFGLGCLGSTVLTLLSPVASYRSVWLLVAVRAIQGLAQGVLLPALFALWSKWAPPLERSKLTTASLTGSYIGNVLYQPISGLLCDSGFRSLPRGSRWPSVFYVLGAVSLVWYVAWLCLIHNSPKSHPRISPEERNYIETAIKEEEKGKIDNENTAIPFGPMIRSPAVWAITIAYCTNDWAFFTLITNVPTFLNDVLGFSIAKATLNKALFTLLSLPFSGWISFSSSIRSNNGCVAHCWVDIRHAKKKTNLVDNKHKKTDEQFRPTTDGPLSRHYWLLYEQMGCI
eukprot:m.263709 g.263709  ORF g.263709 m.263709 type:complete len:367 (+) comp40458_c0_seq31:279-1379(+)